MISIRARSASRHESLSTFVADRPVRTKIFMIVGVLALVSIGVGVVAVQRLSAINQRIDAVNKTNIASLNNLNDMRAGMSAVYNGTAGLEGYYWSPADIKPQFKSTFDLSKQVIADADVAVDKSIAALRKSAAGSRQIIKDLNTLSADLKGYRAFRAYIFYGEPAPQGIDVSIGSTYAFDVQKKIDATIDNLVKVERAEAAKAVKDSKKDYSDSLIWVTGMLVVGLLVASVVALSVAQVITRPIRQVSSALQAAADGDLTQTVQVRSRDELGQMGTALNTMLATMHDVVCEIEKDVADLSDYATMVAEQDSHSLEANELFEIRGHYEAIERLVGVVSDLQANTTTQGPPPVEVEKAANGIVEHTQAIRRVWESLMTIEASGHREAGGSHTRATAAQLASMAQRLDTMVAMFTLESNHKTSHV